MLFVTVAKFDADFFSSWMSEDMMRIIKARSHDKEGKLERNNSSSSLENLNLSTESPSTSPSPITTATKPSSKLFGRLLQQPARVRGFSPGLQAAVAMRLTTLSA